MHQPPALPPWIVIRHRSPALSSSVEEVNQQLDTHQTVWLMGPPGSGKTTVAGSVAANRKPVVAARLAGCTSPADIVLLIGWAVDAPIPGDQSVVGGHLAALGKVLVVLDDVDCPGFDTVQQALAAMAPRARWLLTARTTEHNTVVVLPPPPKPPDLDAVVGADPVRLWALKRLPAGLKADHRLPHTLVMPGEGGREILREAVEAVLPPRPDPLQVHSHILQQVRHLLPIATGAPLPTGLAPPDLFAIRLLALESGDADAACLFGAVAARLLVCWGQASAAHSLVEGLVDRHTEASLKGRALLSWADLRARLQSGSLPEAHRSLEQAAGWLRQARELALLARLHQEWAGALALRAEVQQAAAHTSVARALYRSRGEQGGVAATLRASAEIAILSGEGVSAAALHEQVQGMEAGSTEAANRQFARAILLMSQGRLADAKDQIEPESETIKLTPMLEANHCRLQAELALRHGDGSAALGHLQQALRLYGRLGERIAFGRVWRMIGDAHALRGDPAAAAAAYVESTATLVRTRDLWGLAKTLDHSRELEEAVGNPALAQEIGALAAEARNILADQDEATDSWIPVESTETTGMVPG